MEPLGRRASDCMRPPTKRRAGCGRRGATTPMRTGFDNDKYISLQAERIKERIAQFGGKLYLEFGGKLFDDYHASRVLPGFQPDSKIRMLEQPQGSTPRSSSCINADDIEKSKTRGDLGITYDDGRAAPDRRVPRHRDCYVGERGHHAVRRPARRRRIPHAASTRSASRVVLHYPIAGYPYDIEHIVSDEGYGKNEYVETSRPLVVVTAPGPGTRQDGDLPVTALPRAQARHQGRLRQVRDLPHLEPAAEAPGQPRLRGRDGRSGRREHDRPVPSGGLRRDHRQLQPRRRDLPGAARPCSSRSWARAPTSPPPTWASTWRALRSWTTTRCREAAKHGDRAPLLPDRRARSSAPASARIALGKLELHDEPGRRRRQLLPRPQRGRCSRRRRPAAPRAPWCCPTARVVTGKTSNLLGAVRVAADERPQGRGAASRRASTSSPTR